jgi:hypothetical protein
MTIDEFYEEPHEGIDYKVNNDGTVEVDGQMEMDKKELVN